MMPEAGAGPSPRGLNKLKDAELKDQQVVAAKKGDETKPWAKDLAAAFKSPFFKQVLVKEFPGYTYPAGL